MEDGEGRQTSRRRWQTEEAKQDSRQSSVEQQQIGLVHPIGSTSGFSHLRPLGDEFFPNFRLWA